MANGETQLYSDVATWMQDFTNLLARATELGKRYDDTALADVNALASNTTILTGTPLNKLQWQQARQLVGDIALFAENGAVATAWRRPTAYQIWVAGIN